MFGSGRVASVPDRDDFVLHQSEPLFKSLFPVGAVAQLIERIVRNDEVAGLIPVCSTTFGSAGARRSAELTALRKQPDVTSHQG